MTDSVGEGSATLLWKCKLALFLALWYGSSTWNGISSKRLLNSANVSSFSVAIIIQGAIALSVAQLLLTGVGGLGASYTQEMIHRCRTHMGGPHIGLFQILWSSCKSKLWRKFILSVGLLNFLGVFATNLSFSLGSVSITHLIKASEPVITSFYSYVISPESAVSTKRLAGMVLITLGVATASYSNKVSAFYGIAAALMSSMLFPLRNVLIKKMASTPVKDDLALTGIHSFFVISFISSLVGALVLRSMNASPVIRLPWVEHVHSVFTSSTKHTAYVDAVIATVTFLLYNTFSMTVLQQCSVSTHSIFNVLKRGVVILISAATIDKNFNHHLIVGTSLAMVGLWLYKS